MFRHISVSVSRGAIERPGSRGAVWVSICSMERELRTEGSSWVSSLCDFLVLGITFPWGLGTEVESFSVGAETGVVGFRGGVSWEGMGAGRGGVSGGPITDETKSGSGFFLIRFVGCCCFGGGGGGIQEEINGGEGGEIIVGIICKVVLLIWLLTGFDARVGGSDSLKDRCLYLRMGASRPQIA